MNDIQLKTKEQKTLKFTFQNATTGVIIPLTGATFALVMENLEGVEVVTKADVDFDKSEVASGIVRVTLTEADLTQTAGSYKLEIKTIFTSGEIDKSTIFAVNLIQSIID